MTLVKPTPALTIAERPKSKQAEKILFIMPTDEELFVAALSVIQAYTIEMDKRKLAQHFYVNSENHDLDFLLDVIGDHTKLPAEEIVNHRRFDVVFIFDEKSAYSIAEATDKHVTTSFGIQLGVEPSSLPILENLNWKEVDHDVLLCNNLPEKLISDIQEFLIKKIPESRIFLQVPDAPPIERVLSDVGRCKVIIGMRSLETYVAASAMRKGVIEIYPPGVHQRWLSKWTCTKYQMIKGRPESVTADLIWKGLEALWRVPTYQATAR